MIHSGINAYLSLHVAQVLMRVGDPRAAEIVSAVAHLASPTGQWPEAIHPRTLGGCMGDGQHVWAAVEWIAALRNSFVREAGPDRLVLGAGLPARWLEGNAPLAIGPAPTRFGPIEVMIEPREDGVTVRWQGAWRRPPRIEVQLSGYAPAAARLEDSEVSLDRASVA
jgi:hypothetical protein